MKNKNKETDWKKRKSQIIVTQNILYKAIKYTLKKQIIMK